MPKPIPVISGRFRRSGHKNLSGAQFRPRRLPRRGSDSRGTRDRARASDSPEVRRIGQSGNESNGVCYSRCRDDSRRQPTRDLLQRTPRSAHVGRTAHPQALGHGSRLSDRDGDRRRRDPRHRTDEDRDPEAEQHDPDPARRQLGAHPGEEEGGGEEDNAEHVVRRALHLRACAYGPLLRATVGFASTTGGICVYHRRDPPSGAAPWGRSWVR
jgi:hypothetical protein